MARVNIGWLSCIPGDYNPMNGEPIAQCNSISDQTPCVPGEGPFASSGYCPSMMPGYPGLLAGMGFVSTAPETCGPDSDLSTCIPSGSPAATPGSAAVILATATGCTIASGPNAGQSVPCPTNSVTVTAEPFNWWLAGGVAIGALLLLAAVRR